MLMPRTVEVVIGDSLWLNVLAERPTMMGPSLCIQVHSESFSEDLDTVGLHRVRGKRSDLRNRLMSLVAGTDSPFPGSFHAVGFPYGATVRTHVGKIQDNVFSLDMWWDKSGRTLAHGTWRNSKRWDGTFLDFDGGGLAAYRFWIQQYNDGARGDAIPVDGSLIDIGRDATAAEIRTWRLFYTSHTMVFIVAIVWPFYMLLRHVIKKSVKGKGGPSLSGIVPQHID